MDINALKQAAIDAYMRSAGFSVHDDFYLDYGLGYSTTIGKDGKGTTTYSGGGYPGVPPPTTDEDYTDKWATVRTRVDNALKPWQEDRLPTSSSMHSGMQTALDAVTALRIGQSPSFAGDLGGYMKTVGDNAALCHGAAMDAFNNSFANQIPKAVNNHGCLAAVVAEAWSAEEEIWKKAREDRDSVVEHATTALKNYAESEGPNDLKFALALAGAAIAGASAVVTGGATLPFALASAGITSLAATADYAGELKVERKGANYEELMTAFEHALGDVDQGIWQQEMIVRRGLLDAYSVFMTNEDLFNLTPRVSDDGDGDWDDETSLYDVKDAAGLGIILPGGGVINSLYSGLTNLSHGVDTAEPKVTTGADDGGVLAPSAREVGLRYHGVDYYMNRIGNINASSLRDLSWDLREGKAMLEAVIRDFREADSNSQSNLDKTRKRLAAGSGDHPWI